MSAEEKKTKIETSENDRRGIGVPGGRAELEVWAFSFSVQVPLGIRFLFCCRKQTTFDSTYLEMYKH